MQDILVEEEKNPLQTLLHWNQTGNINQLCLPFRFHCPKGSEHVFLRKIIKPHRTVMMKMVQFCRFSLRMLESRIINGR